MIARSTVLAGLGAAVAGTAIPRIARAQATPIPLRIAGVFSDLFAEPFYINDAGAFAKAGFDVQTTSLNNAGAVVAAIGGGSLEMGTGDLVSGINAINAGVPIVMIAGGGLYSDKLDTGTTILAVLSDSPVRDPKDLIGKSIGVPTLVGLTTACLRAWLPAHGVDLASVKLVEIPQSSVVPALQRGTLDVALLSEPFLTYGKGLVRSVGYPFEAATSLSPAREFCVSVWYASQSWFQSDPVRAKTALQAIYDTARWANAHQAQTLAILAQNASINPDLLRGMVRVEYATAATPATLQPMLNIGLTEKLIPAIDAGTLLRA